MKKTIKVVSILISVFMFMQTMAGAVLAAEEGSIECPCAAKVCYDLGIMPNVYEDADKFVTYDGFHRIVANLFGYSKPTVAPHDNITLGDVLSIICAKTFGSSSEEIIVISGMRNNIEIDDSANITYAQLAKVVYDTLLYRTITVGEGGFVIDERGNMGRENYKSVTGGLLYNKGYVKYVGDVTVSGDTAAVSGKLYDMENQHGT